MKAGPLRSPVTIQRQASEQDMDGQPINAWSEVAKVRADIRHQSGLETLKGDAYTSIVKASIRIRYREDVDAGMRVLHGAVVYDIKAVLPDMRRRQYLDLVCEVVNAR